MSDQISDPKRTAVLVVDDSKVIRVALQRILRAQNTVYEAVDGEQALELLQQYPDIGLVLTDLSMPGIDGQDLLLRIRDGVDDVPTDLPVVIVTGQESDEAASDEWRSLGANTVLMKPFVPTRVREVVAELLPPPPVTPPAAPPEAAVDSGETQALRDEVERLRRELMLRQQSSNEREAQKELERLRNALGEARDESTVAFQRAEEREGEIESLQARLQETEAALAEAQARGAELEITRAQAEDRERELEALRTRVEELETAAAPGEADSGSETLRARVHELEGENVRLDHELVELDRQREGVQKELKDARAEADRLRRERNQQCERAAAAEKALAEAEQRCTDLQESVSDRGDRLEAREGELAEAQQRNQDLRGRIRDLENALTGHSSPAVEEPVSEPSRGASVQAEPEDSPRASLFGAKHKRSARLGRRLWFRVAFVGVLAVVVALGVAIYLRGA